MPWSQLWPSAPSVQSHPPPAGIVQLAVKHAHVEPAAGQLVSAQQTEPGTAVVSHSVLVAAPGLPGSGAPHVQPAVPVTEQLVVYFARLASAPVAPSPPPPPVSVPIAASLAPGPSLPP
jgi:hypothetical protein